jgi:hypothetical protein
MSPVFGTSADSLREKIRAALAVGTLPRINLKLWAGESDGSRACACRGLLIQRDEVGYGPRLALGLYAHFPCFTTWRAESERLEQPGGAAPGAMAADV